MQTFLRIGIFALAIMLAQAIPAYAGPFGDGEAAYVRGEFATALQLWRPLAEQGDVGAQYYLAVMYDYGRGVPQDDAEAAKWYRMAAEQGNAQGTAQPR